MTIEDEGCYCLRERRALEQREDVEPKNWCADWPGCQSVFEGKSEDFRGEEV